MGKASARIADNSDSKEFAALLGESMSTQAFEGNVVKGKIIEVQEDAVIIDVGLKSEGRVALREFTMPGQDPEVRQLTQEALGTGRRIDDEEPHRPRPGVERGVKAAFGHEHCASWADIARFGYTVGRFNHLLAATRDHEDDFF